MRSITIVGNFEWNINITITYFIYFLLNSIITEVSYQIISKGTLKYNYLYSKTSDIWRRIEQKLSWRILAISFSRNSNDEICTAATCMVLTNVITNIYYYTIINPY